jgi:hypothetical protein
MWQGAPQVLCWVLAPIYDWQDAGTGTWPKWIHDVMLPFELLAILYWLIPSRDRLGRMASLYCFGMFGYLLYVHMTTQHAPWYFPPLAFMSVLAIVSAAATATDRIRNRAMAALTGILAVAGLGGLLGFIFFSSITPIRFKQDVIEWGHRREIGLWLKAHVQPGETVYLESLGYIGYFSRCTMLDWPGLVSPKVVAARRILGLKSGYTFIPVAEKLQPSWIVARLDDIEELQHTESLSKNYTIVKTFDVTQQARDMGDIPGIRMVYGECRFYILRRTP